eukprot:TRINITY_DN62805_c0_g1_i1.p1 TRINITY_DN62805_c0_g1~~TRINITY_DN62805_c0_g1_i1.p1  ORF type:complete len:330 (+),score=34.06 TRINITY_DN62805_c0_g1_i1:111-1100(+)
MKDMTHRCMDGFPQTNEFIPNKIVGPLPECDIRQQKCMARTWGSGFGAQCRRPRFHGTDLCRWHGDALPHGRIDGFVPENKAREFIVAWRSRGGKPSIQDSEDGVDVVEEMHRTGPLRDHDGEDAEHAKKVHRTSPPRNLAERTELTGIIVRVVRAHGEAAWSLCLFSQDLFLALLEFLDFHSLLRAAPTCSTVSSMVLTPRLYRSLRLCSVGKASTRNRRRTTCLANEALRFACMAFLGQARFRKVLEIDVSGVNLGDNIHPDENAILCHAAACCPDVQMLRLGTPEPGFIWSVLKSRLPVRFERALRRWWRTRPLIVEAYDRTYILT